VWIKELEKVFFHMIYILIGESQCHIQFLSLAYRKGVSDLNVVSGTLQRLSGMYYTNLRSLRLAYYQKHLEDVS